MQSSVLHLAFVARYQSSPIFLWYGDRGGRHPDWSGTILAPGFESVRGKQYKEHKGHATVLYEEP